MYFHTIYSKNNPNYLNFLPIQGVGSGGGAVSINLDGGVEEEDRVALLGAPSDEDLEVGMINENSRHLS